MAEGHHLSHLDWRRRLSPMGSVRRYVMIARRPFRSINRKAVPAVKTLVDYLNDQDAILDNVIKILAREYNAIKERRLDELEAIAEDKSSFMLKLQANDQRIKLHADAAQLKTKYPDRVEQIKAKLAKCKMMNETNGKLITLSLSANKRLYDVLMHSRDKFSRNMTYTDKGNTTATSPLRVNINA